jgi:hypothetical protein
MRYLEYNLSSHLMVEIMNGDIFSTGRTGTTGSGCS